MGFPHTGCMVGDMYHVIKVGVMIIILHVAVQVEGEGGRRGWVLAWGLVPKSVQFRLLLQVVLAKMVRWYYPHTFLWIMHCHVYIVMVTSKMCKEFSWC